MRMFWSSRSPFARKAAMVAHECDLFGRLDLIDVPIPGPGPHPELNRATPIAKLPTLVTEGGLVIAGSPVICDYFDTLGQRGLIPAGAGALARPLAPGDGRRHARHAAVVARGPAATRSLPIGQAAGHL
ncbi:glutathione S-transferase N-terminal domain-containing protein [Rhizorhabdus histidinilytica]